MASNRGRRAEENEYQSRHVGRPTGGYSFRMRRVNWMKEHGYEIVGKARDNSMLVSGGDKLQRTIQKACYRFRC